MENQGRGKLGKRIIRKKINWKKENWGAQTSIGIWKIKQERKAFNIGETLVPLRT